MKKTKICSKCHKEKSLYEFFNDKKGKFGKQAHCKECARKRFKKYYLNNQKEIITQHQSYYKNNKLIISIKQKEWRKQNKDKIKQRLQKNKLKIKQQRHNKYLETIQLNPDYNHQRYLKRKDYYLSYHKIYYKNNKTEINKQKNEYTKKKKQENIGFKILCNLRVRIYDVLKGRTKSDTTKKLTGCSIEFLKKHLESQFKKGMNWSNYGKGGWNIDHIRPCASFDLTKPSEQRKCFNYKNLQPLWEEENLRKSDKLFS